MTAAERVPDLTLAEARTRMTVNVPQAAQLLGISEWLAYRAVRSGQIPTLRLGRRILVPVAALLEMHPSGGGGLHSDREPA